MILEPVLRSETHPDWKLEKGDGNENSEDGEYVVFEVEIFSFLHLGFPSFPSSFPSFLNKNENADENCCV